MSGTAQKIKNENNKLNEMTANKTTYTVEIKPGEKFRAGKDGYTHIQLHRDFSQLEFLIEYKRNPKEKGIPHSGEVLTKIGKEHKLNLESGLVTWKITGYNKKTDKYTIEITDESRNKNKDKIK